LHSVPGIPDEEDEAVIELYDFSRNTSSSSEPRRGQGSRPKFTEHVDRLEMALSKCLSEYRAQAEDVIAEHLTALESIQNSYEHEIAGMQLENATLRGKLGLHGPEEVQKVLFQAAPPPEPTHPGRPRAGRPRWLDEPESPKRSVSTVKSKASLHSRKGQPAPSGMPSLGAGSWQAFMAWVPNGAALHHPEPWKALDKLEKLEEPRQPPIRRRSTGSAPSTERSERGTHFASVVPDSGKNGFGEKPRHVAVDLPADETESDSDETRTVLSKEDFEVVDMFQASDRLARKLRAHNKQETASETAYREHETDFAGERRKWYIMNPDTMPRIAWDVASLLMISYDMIFVPLEVCFNPEKTGFPAVMDWTTRLFWTFDMGMSCITGFVFADGVIQYDTREILRHYGRTWFVPDVAIVSWDWIGYLVSGDGLGLGQLARAIRMARAVRLLRLLRMQEVLANLTERLQSDVLEVVMQILKLVLILVVACHFMACFWWAVGSNGEGSTWVKAGGYEDFNIQQSYLVCLYWAITQFAGGTHNVYPETAGERLYGVAAGVLSFVLMMVLFGTLTSGLTQRHIIDGSGQRQLATLKTYLLQNNMPKNLMKRLLRNAKHAISGDLNAETVQLLTVISEPLKIQMHFEMYSRILHHHPFFRDLLSAGNALVRRICHQAMAMLLLASGDAVFELDEEPHEPKMYVVAAGQLEYCAAFGEVEQVGERDFLAEAVLWTRWRHRGTLVATSDAKMASLDANSFQEICEQAISKKNAACLPIIAYANEFVKELNEAGRPSDLLGKRKSLK